MTLVKIFKEFITVFEENKKYTIGLLNEYGKVLCCSDSKYVDTYVNINSKENNIVIRNISINNDNYGYLWITGDVDSLKMISSLVYDALITRLTYHINTNSIKQKVTLDDELVKCLLDVNNFDLNHILNLVSILGIYEKKSRAAIYIINDNGFNSEEVINLKLRKDSKELIYSLLDDNRLLLFKDIPDDLDKLQIKKYFRKYIQSLQDWGFQDCRFIIGSIQNKLKKYNVSYKNCTWLEQNNQLTENEPIFFMDYLLEYVFSKIQTTDISDIFDFYKDQHKEIDIDEFVKISDQLIVNDYNITQTAQDLFLHKNTLIYKIKKYEEIFNIDIRGSFNGKILLALISATLKKYQKQKQVGE
ncbi:PucR family transcriptional regulator [Clostridium nigeriense]|uniref:PucR family transcriptional regulator n=1 Tax=Clostridium nigeriense TaxID=1805470 RepID=UPI003D325A81